MPNLLRGKKEVRKFKFWQVILPNKKLNFGRYFLPKQRDCRRVSCKRGKTLILAGNSWLQKMANILQRRKGGGKGEGRAGASGKGRGKGQQVLEEQLPSAAAVTSKTLWSLPLSSPRGTALSLCLPPFRHWKVFAFWAFPGIRCKNLNFCPRFGQNLGD